MANLLPHIYLSSAKFTSIDVTPRTTWTFVEISDTEGFTEVVEIGSNRAMTVPSSHTTKSIASLIAESLESLKTAEISEESDIPIMLGLEPLTLQTNHNLATVVSALRTAVTCLQAKHMSISLGEALGASSVKSIPLYANINRSLLGRPRTPSDFAREAELAVANGFSTIKCNPFDEVNRTDGHDANIADAKTGLDRVTKIRESVGDQVNVLVDCHEKFGLEAAIFIAKSLSELKIGWLEEPIPLKNNSQELILIAQQLQIPLAGGENGYGKDYFDGLVLDGFFNIIMPDIKFCGGASEAHNISLSTLRNAGQVSFHNPSGPVSQLCSAQVTAAIPNILPLEHATGEIDWRADLMNPPEIINNGRYWLPDGCGLGASLNQELINAKGVSW